jgi:hypothetical protein
LNQKLQSGLIIVSRTITNYAKLAHQVVAIGKWKLRRSYWKGDDYLEILDASGRERVEYLKSLGCLTEMVKFTTRVYVPRNDQMMAVLERLKGS